jgi:hypothetical protein
VADGDGSSMTREEGEETLRSVAAPPEEKEQRTGPAQLKPQRVRRKQGKEERRLGKLLEKQL